MYAAPFPECFKTRFWLEGDYKVSAATASSTGGVLAANNLTNPLWPGGASAFPSFTYLGPATEATLQPTGYSNLAGSTFYLYYKVTACRVRVNWQQGIAQSDVFCTIVPTLDNTKPSSQYIARTQPMAKSGTFSSGKANAGAVKGGWLSHSVTPARVLGYTREQARLDIGNFNTTVSTGPFLGFAWKFFFQTTDESVTTGIATFRIRLEWDVELRSAVPEMKTT